MQVNAVHQDRSTSPLIARNLIGEQRRNPLRRPQIAGTGFMAPIN
jgi:hypothetical protein